MVFCRERGWKEDEEAVEARDGVCSITDIVPADSRTALLLSRSSWRLSLLMRLLCSLAAQ